jgi:hypothetical protein
MRDSRIRLPDDIVPEDGLIAALACTDLGPDKEWDDARRVPVPSAGFLCEPNGPNFAGIRRQAARMVNYSIGHFQNRIVSDIMGKEGPAALPRLLAELYPAYLPRFKPRLDPVWFAFDRRALALMRERSSASP